MERIQTECESNVLELASAMTAANARETASVPGCPDLAFFRLTFLVTGRRNNTGLPRHLNVETRIDSLQYEDGCESALLMVTVCGKGTYHDEQADTCVSDSNILGSDQHGGSNRTADHRGDLRHWFLYG